MAGGLTLDLKVIPNAKADKIESIIHDADGRPRLAVRVKAPPVDGKANAAVIALLARRLNTPRKTLAVTAGTTARRKRVTWHEPAADAEQRLAALLTGKDAGSS